MRQLLRFLGVILLLSLIVVVFTNNAEARFASKISSKLFKKGLTKGIARNIVKNHSSEITKYIKKGASVDEITEVLYKSMDGDILKQFPHQALGKVTDKVVKTSVKQADEIGEGTKKVTKTKGKSVEPKKQNGANAEKATKKSKGVTSNSTIVRKTDDFKANPTRGPTISDEVNRLTPSPPTTPNPTIKKLSEVKYKTEYGKTSYNAQQARLKKEMNAGKISKDDYGVYSTKKMNLDVDKHGGIIMSHKEYNKHMKSVIPSWKYKKHTKRNYRHNLSVLTKEAGGGKDAHHVFPQRKELKNKIERIAGININDPIYMTWWNKRDHRRNAQKYDKEWDEFFEINRNPTKDKILQFGRQKNEEYKLKTYF